MDALNHGSGNTTRLARAGIVTAIDPFEDRNEFQDEVHGPIRLNQLEHDAIDAPEFQRLFRVAQLGLVDLVFPSANHTRGSHSIGTCHVAKKLIRQLARNREKVPDAPTITHAESVLISLGALLHDVCHGPFSHDIEKKTHKVPPAKVWSESTLPIEVPGGPDEKWTKVKSYYGPYEKHDDFERNPTLYVLLLDPSRSILARVLRQYSPTYWQLLNTDAKQPSNIIQPFVARLNEADIQRDWPELASDLLPFLLFHLLVFEKPEEGITQSTITVATNFDGGESLPHTEKWGLGPEGYRDELHGLWYQPFRHDIVGNTLSADLIDYLQRDLRRLGAPKTLDLKLLKSYVLVEWPKHPAPAPDAPDQGPLFGQEDKPAAPYRRTTLKTYRTAIDLRDQKRVMARPERINDVFRLLDLRHEIHEKAVYHRVVQASIAMLCRSIMLLDDAQKPRPESLCLTTSTETPALIGDDHFLGELVRLSVEKGDHDGNSAAHSIAMKLAERRVYRPLLIVPGDHVRGILGDVTGHTPGTVEHLLRAFAALIDSARFAPFFLFISWTIEAFLEHGLRDRSEVFSFLDRVRTSSDPTRFTALRRLVPRRVIAWTTPYKQLYKDPALLVSLGADTIVTIDHLVQTLQGQTGHESIRHRVEMGLNDAEAKYRSLWKLYVFVSDGLFAGGLVAKLLSEDCSSSSEAHKSHLKQAQHIYLLAIRAAWRRWVVDLKKQPDELNRVLTDAGFQEELRALLHGLTRGEADALETELGSKQKEAAEMFAALIDLYSHDGRQPLGCRDIRYSFDLQCPQEGLGEGSDLLRLVGATWKDLRMEEAIQFRAHIMQEESRAALLDRHDAMLKASLRKDQLKIFRQVWLGRRASTIMS